MTDPLIQALIDKLPPVGGPFAAEQRASWLKMMAMGFDVAYGPADELPDFLGAARSGSGTGVASSARGPAKPAPVSGDEEPRYFIAADGRALRDPGGVPIGVNDIPPTEVIWDDRAAGARDLDTIVWKDGSWPAAALPSLNFAGGD